MEPPIIITSQAFLALSELQPSQVEANLAVRIASVP
jgi:hypothetical protein